MIYNLWGGPKKSRTSTFFSSQGPWLRHLEEDFETDESFPSQGLSFKAYKMHITAIDKV